MNGIASGKVGINWYFMWNFCSVTPLKVIEVTRGHQQFFANNLRSKWDKDMGLMSLRLSLQGASNDVWCTYLGHRVTLPWLDLRSNFDLDLWRSNYTWFDAPWRDKHDRVTTVVLSFKTKTLSSKNHFDLWWPQFWPELKNERSSFRMIFRTPFSVLFYDAQEPR